LLIRESNPFEHQKVNLEAARKALILLKNQGNVLPLEVEKITSIALIGPSANLARIDGFGSADVVYPVYTVNPREGIANQIGMNKVNYVQGCDIASNDTSGFAAARSAAANADVVIYIGGLDKTQEGEGYDSGGDRKNKSIELPGVQKDLIHELAKVNNNTIVVLESGGICAVHDFIDEIEALIYAFYPGSEGGNALADVLFGEFNPAGRLPVTMPISDEQMPEWNDDFTDDYGCGYRYYDETETPYEYAFGYGLSYTTFSYSNISLSKSTAQAGESITVSFDITNTGQLPGDEVPQLYLTENNPTKWMPKKQLKGFDRVNLNPGESKTISMKLTPEEFYTWDVQNDNYIIEEGNYTVKVGGSSDNLPLEASFKLNDNVNQADLAPVKIYSVPRFPVPGQKVKFAVSVKNIGTTEAFRNISVDFKIDGNVVASAENTTVKVVPGGGMLIMSGGDGYTTSDVGELDLSVEIDVGNQLTEILETNNELASVLKVYEDRTDPTEYNLAYNKPIDVSSIENIAHAPEHINDANYSTRWSSKFVDPQWFEVDLRDQYQINEIKLLWEASYAKKYIIEISENRRDWDTLAVEPQGNGGTDHFYTNAIGRYIRFTGTQRALQYGYSLYEFEALGELAVIDEIKSPKIDKQIPYPNPVQDKLTVHGLRGSWKIYDIYGNQLLKGRGEEIDMQELNGGEYIIEIKNAFCYKCPIET
jgi:hypothetical protein